MNTLLLKVLTNSLFSLNLIKLYNCFFFLIYFVDFKLKGLASITCYIGSRRRLQLSRKEIIAVLKNPTIPVADLDESTRSKLHNFGN